MASRNSLQQALEDVRTKLSALGSLPESISEGATGDAQIKMVDAYDQAINDLMKMTAAAQTRALALGGSVQKVHDALSSVPELPSDPNDLTEEHVAKLRTLYRASEAMSQATKTRMVTVHPRKTRGGTRTRDALSMSTKTKAKTMTKAKAKPKVPGA